MTNIDDPIERSLEEAADFLNVCRPYVHKLLDSGKVPANLFGGHRRLRMKDLREYHERDLTERARAATQLTEEAEKLGLGY